MLANYRSQPRAFMQERKITSPPPTGLPSARITNDERAIPFGAGGALLAKPQDRMPILTPSNDDTAPGLSNTRLPDSEFAIEDEQESDETVADASIALLESGDLEGTRNAEALAAAFDSLAATKTRTGVPATRVDLHRVIKRFALSPVDAAELDARAEHAGLVEDRSLDELEDGRGFDPEIVHMFLDDAKRYRLLRPEEHLQLARSIAIGLDATKTLQQANNAAPNRENLEKLAEEGRRAFRRFVASNLRLVVSIAKTYLNRGMEFADLIQEGCFGLMRAVELYEPQAGTQFSTYAYYWIMQSISRAIADKSRLVRLPVHAHDTSNQIRRAMKSLGSRFGRDPTPAEIAEHLNLTRERVLVLMQWMQQPISIDAPAVEEGDSDIADFIPSRDPPIADIVAEKERNRALLRLLDENLTVKQSDILKLRFGLNGGRELTLEAVGQRYGVTRERIRQIESKALKILRNRFVKYRLLEY
jgi:RNA polymerase primary sigma factor